MTDIGYHWNILAPQRESTKETITVILTVTSLKENTVYFVTTMHGNSYWVHMDLESMPEEYRTQFAIYPASMIGCRFSIEALDQLPGDLIFYPKTLSRIVDVNFEIKGL